MTPTGPPAGSEALLPALFRERLLEILPAARRESGLRSFSRIRPTSFRLNPLKTSAPALLEELRIAGIEVSPVGWREGTYTVVERQRRALTECAAFLEGRLYIQGLSSMLAPMLLGPRPGETVLDLAAAPGGKTLQMAALMENRGRISAVESVKRRFFRLKANLERHGASMVRGYLMDGRAVGAKVPERFDRVLLDTPCSSEARFTTLDPASWSHWNLKKVKESARKQSRLLDSAFRSLKPNGVLVYCTCSFSPEENEQVIDRLLKRHGGAVDVAGTDLPLDNLQPGILGWGGRQFDPRVGRAVRVLPSGDMAGFFLCRLTKVG